MPRTYLCFVWHMHQPCYKDLVTGEYHMPWTRMHALKDYFGMVKILKDFPGVRQTFNLVPSLVMQIEEYASGVAADPFLRAALKPAEELEEQEKHFLLRYFFQANETHLIGRYPRYAELWNAWNTAGHNLQRCRNFFNTQAFRDLQILSQIAWFDEEFLAHDGEIAALVNKGRDYSPGDQEAMGRKQREILSHVLPVYREFAASGQIEISATPFYHPILPLLCDSNVAHEANPYVPLPSRFRYPQDARLQLQRAASYVEERVGVRPTGLWPSEGSVSDEALAIAAETGFRWAATDNGVLAKSLNKSADPMVSYRPYLWRKDGRELGMIFRDHYLSDLVGFVYSRMSAEQAAADFLHRIRENCAPVLAAGRDALVPIILDGENAWEHYPRNGRPFLAELYRLIEAESGMRAVTVSEAFRLMEPEPLDHIAPGSWINANFDVWIGFEEDNIAWEHLRKAREAFEAVDAASVPAADYALALEELLIAEGSDWCWWYGPHHDCDNREEFDQLYRNHLVNVYRALRLTPPAELSRPVLRKRSDAVSVDPSATIHPVIDGEVTSYFEWMGAGSCQASERSGAMHGAAFVLKEILYGSDGSGLFLRIDLANVALEKTEIRACIDSVSVRILIQDGNAQLLEGVEGMRMAFRTTLELALPLQCGKSVEIEVSAWRDGLPVDALPRNGAIHVKLLPEEGWAA
ncbi:MAG: glycoside hydrolase [Candidatus Solibacter usitatus]|nr:glycoside hydrolase [Candidatus Solibacter usitatus]